MLKFGASQHFQEVSHEPPGTERGEKCVGDGVGGCRGWMWVCVCCMLYVCVMYACGCVSTEGVGRGVGLDGVVGMAWSRYVLGEVGMATWTQTLFSLTLCIESR